VLELCFNCAWNLLGFFARSSQVFLGHNSPMKFTRLIVAVLHSRVNVSKLFLNYAWIFFKLCSNNAWILLPFFSSFSWTQQSSKVYWVDSVAVLNSWVNMSKLVLYYAWILLKLCWHCAWIVLDLCLTCAQNLLVFFSHSFQAFLGLNSIVKCTRLTLLLFFIPELMCQHFSRIVLEYCLNCAWTMLGLFSHSSQVFLGLNSPVKFTGLTL
jgi:hypothetical protein